jgi:hypothetical protein
VGSGNAKRSNNAHKHTHTYEASDVWGYALLKNGERHGSFSCLPHSFWARPVLSSYCFCAPPMQGRKISNNLQHHSDQPTNKRRSRSDCRPSRVSLLEYDLLPQAFPASFSPRADPNEGSGAVAFTNCPSYSSHLLFSAFSLCISLRVGP